MIGGLLRQVISGGAGIPGEAQRAFNGLGRGGLKFLRLSDAPKLFVSSTIERVYICVDAVDELLPQDRSELPVRYDRLLKMRQIPGYFLQGGGNLQSIFGMCSSAAYYRTRRGMEFRLWGLQGLCARAGLGQSRSPGGPQINHGTGTRMETYARATCSEGKSDWDSFSCLLPTSPPSTHSEFRQKRKRLQTSLLPFLFPHLLSKMKQTYLAIGISSLHIQ